MLDTIPKIDTVHICVDKDEAGDKTTVRIGEELDKRGTFYNRLLPENKDWNEDLIAKNEQNRELVMEM